jgi:hypothetical protein
MVKQLVEVLCYKPRFRFPMSSLGHFIDYMALVSIQPLIEMSIIDIYQDGKDGQCVSLTTLTPSRAACLEILGA